MLEENIVEENIEEIEEKPKRTFKRPTIQEVIDKGYDIMKLIDEDKMDSDLPVKFSWNSIIDIVNLSVDEGEPFNLNDDFFEFISVVKDLKESGNFL